MRTIKFRYQESPSKFKYVEISDDVYSYKWNGPLAGQYTGIKDKNGVEIYEGDIVMDETIYYDLWPHPGLFKDNKVVCSLEVYWDKNYGGFGVKNDSFDYADFTLGERSLKVVGNIFDNFNLLDE